jgi:hypothetical protein
MPLAEVPEGADEKRREKTMNARRRLLEKAQEKYGFKVEPLSAPEALLVEDGRVVGLRLRRTQMKDGKLISTDETYEQRGSCVISSIGSIPEAIPGIPLRGELFAFTDWEIGRLDGYPSLFSVGNVVTGKGNIVASRKHAAQVYEDALASFLGLGDDGHAAEAALASRAETSATQTAQDVVAHLAQAEPPTPEVEDAILERVRERQKQVGYGGDLEAWLAQVTPAPLEPR